MSHDDKINPSHYKSSESGVECIEVTRHMMFDVGNAVKYLWRLGQKDDNIVELKKAQWYLQDQLKTDQEAGIWMHVHNWAVFVKKFQAHIDSVPEGPVKRCLQAIANYHSHDYTMDDIDRRNWLRLAIEEVEVAILWAKLLDND